MKKLLALVLAAAMLLGVCSLTLAEDADLESVLSGALEEYPGVAYALGYAQGFADETTEEAAALNGCLCPNCENRDYCLNCTNGCSGLCSIDGYLPEQTDTDPFGFDLFEGTFLANLIPKELIASLYRLFGGDVPKNETASETEDRCIECDLTALASSLLSLIQPIGEEGFTLSSLMEHIANLIYSFEEEHETEAIDNLEDMEGIAGLEEIAALEGLAELEELAELAEFDDTPDILAFIREYLDNVSQEDGYSEASAYSSEYSSFSDGDKTTYNVDSNLSYKAPNGRWINVNRTENEKPGSRKTSVESGQL